MLIVLEIRQSLALRDRAQLQQLADSAYQNMLQQGINLREIELTSNGFTSL